MEAKSILDVSVPYPLMDRWKFSSRNTDLNNPKSKQQDEKDWLSSFKEIYIFDSIQKFWELVNNFPGIVQVPHGATFAFFKKKGTGHSFIQPSWEDSNNKNGYTYSLYIPTKDKGYGILNDGNIHYIYIDILMLLIGATLPFHDKINGCTFDRKFTSYKFSIWVGAPLKESDEYNQLIGQWLNLQQLIDHKLLSLTIESNKEQ